MKKQNLFLFLFCSLLSPAFAQVTIGVQGGYTLSTLTNNSTYPDHVPGFCAGIHATYPLKKWLALVGELNYETRGSQGTLTMYDTTGTSLSSHDMSLHLNYITLPVMARFYGPKIKAVHFYAEAGLYYGYLLSAKADLPDAVAETGPDVTSAFTRHDFGLTGGIGAEYWFGEKLGVNAGCRYSAGLINVVSRAGGGNQQNSSFLFQLGFSYRPWTEKG